MCKKKGWNARGFKHDMEWINKMAVDTSFWCERVRICFPMFVQHPHTLQHLLLFGPPGSGKTTSAAWLVEQIWDDLAAHEGPIPLPDWAIREATRRRAEMIANPQLGMTHAEMWERIVTSRDG
jgi:predicted NACHT family NTPase